MFSLAYNHLTLLLFIMGNCDVKAFMTVLPNNAIIENNNKNNLVRSE